MIATKKAVIQFFQCYTFLRADKLSSIQKEIQNINKDNVDKKQNWSNLKRVSLKNIPKDKQEFFFSNNTGIIKFTGKFKQVVGFKNSNSQYAEIEIVPGVVYAYFQIFYKYRVSKKRKWFYQIKYRTIKKNKNNGQKVNQVHNLLIKK